MIGARPLFFGSPGRELFGWHHPPEGPARSTVVVLCPPLGFDYMSAYLTWRVMAERMAATGFDVLRFDYLGTGESAGGPEDPRQVESWLQSLDAAVSEARVRSGAARVVLVGLRLGSTLAAHVASRLGGVDGLVLWDPFRSGKAYLREIRALARLSEGGDRSESDDIGAAGFLVTGSTARELEQLDLGRMEHRPAPRVLVIERDDRGRDPRLAEQLRALGSVVESDRLPGTADALNSDLISMVPELIIQRIVAWLHGGHPERGAPRPPPEIEATAAVSSDQREQAFFFGPDQRLFGVLNVPPRAASRNVAIILLNTGCQYRAGPHRLYVPLARRWADNGYAVFRFDLGGIGDSRPPAGADGHVAYPPHAMGDITDAITTVRARTGARRILIAGLCAGGWHSFQAARDGLAVDGFFAVNPPLYLRDAPEFRVLAVRWKKALLRRASLRNVARDTATAIWAGARDTLELMRPAADRDGLERDLMQISRRGIASHFTYSRTDRSFSYFQIHARDSLRRSRNLVKVEVVDGADHIFRPLGAQAELVTLLDRFLEEQGWAEESEISEVS